MISLLASGSWVSDWVVPGTYRAVDDANEREENSNWWIKKRVLGKNSERLSLNF